MALSRLLRLLGRVGMLVRLRLGDPLGRGLPLPPGGLGVSSIARLGDERFYLRQRERHGPIFKVLWNKNLTTCIVGFDRARRLFALHAEALLPLTIDIRAFVPHGFIRSMVRDKHARYRSVFLAAVSDDLTEVWDRELRTLIRAELMRVADATHAGSRPASPVLTPALDRIATRALLMMFFGLRPDHPEFAAFETAYRRMGPTEFVHPIGPEQRAAFDTLRGLVWSTVGPPGSRAVEGLGESVLRRLVTSEREALDETVVGNLVYMVEMGRYDVRSLMRWVLKYLSDAPTAIEDWRVCRQDPAAVERHSFAEAVVLETLRLDQAEALNRAVTSDIVFDGYRLPQGSALRVLLRESHRDPSVFAEPDRFKPCRWAGDSYSGQVYAPFGIGEHRCIAARMVVRLTTILVEELVAGFTWSVVGDGHRHRGRYHWEPAPGFELALRCREARMTLQ